MNNDRRRRAGYGAKPGAIAICFSLFASGSAFSHAFLEAEQTRSGATYEAIINLPHGCDGLPTDTVLVKVPENMVVLQAPEAEGWTVTGTAGKLDKPVTVNGSVVEESIVALKWTGGSIPDEDVGQVRFGGQIVDGLEPGTKLHFMVVQQCEDKAVRWIEIQKEGQDMSDMEAPAPFLTIVDEMEKSVAGDPGKMDHSKHAN